MWSKIARTGGSLSAECVNIKLHCGGERVLIVSRAARHVRSDERGDSVAKVLFHYRPKFFWAADAIFG